MMKERDTIWQSNIGAKGLTELPNFCINHEDAFNLNFKPREVSIMLFGCFAEKSTRVQQNIDSVRKKEDYIEIMKQNLSVVS